MTNQVSQYEYFLSQSSDSVSVIFYTVMTNIVFSAGFHIDKQKLNKLVVQNPMFYNLYETNFGYTGMNLKIPLVDTWRNFPIKKYSFNGDLSNWIVSELCFDTYFQENLKHQIFPSKYPCVLSINFTFRTLCCTFNVSAN